MGRGLVKDAATMAVVAKVNDILRGCDRILSEHGGRAEQGLYGDGEWAKSLAHDLWSVRARLDRVSALIVGSSEELPPQ
ncbi:MAG: hypothetical protein IKT26_00545 [Bacteroidaceae bacterium]|nr:hypothetical protein [Bacteroidaceae bacterium]